MQAAYDKLRSSTPAGVETDMVMIEALSGVASARLGELARHFDMTIVGQDDQGGIGDEPGSSPRFCSAPAGLSSSCLTSTRARRRSITLSSLGTADWPLRARSPAPCLLLRGASRVEVVTIAPKGEPVDELPGFNITRHLARHGVKAELRQLGPADDIGAALLAHTTNTGADFLVMGGYGHSRVREFIFGGTTRQILSSMTLPVLMVH
jgi:nucleotide-binding universal stress UspA family protein